jgi:hypothetical protein
MLGRVDVNQLERCLPLVFRTRKAVRHRPLELLEEIEKRAASYQNRNLADTYSGANGAFLFYRFELGKRYGGAPLARLIHEAVSHSHISPRLLACDWIADETTPQQIRDRFGESLLQDKSPLVRARAFWRIANIYPKSYEPQIEHALMDPNASVQAAARNAWKTLHKDALSLYRKRIGEVTLPSATVSALRGLRAESNVEDEAVVRPFLRHNSAKVRREALRTLVTWNVSDTINLLQDGLRNSSPSDSKSAAGLLMARPNLLSLPLLRDLLVQPPHADSPNIALRLLVKLPKWSSLPLILLAYSFSSYRERAFVLFQNWNKNYNRVQSTPSRAQAADTIKAFQTIAGSPLFIPGRRAPARP